VAVNQPAGTNGAAAKEPPVSTPPEDAPSGASNETSEPLATAVPAATDMGTVKHVQVPTDAPAADSETGETPEIVTAPVLVVAPPAEPAPAPRAAEPPAPAESAKPKPPPETVRLVMVNANHGARFPGDVVTVDALVGAELIRNGEAFPAPR